MLLANIMKLCTYSCFLGHVYSLLEWALFKDAKKYFCVQRIEPIYFIACFYRLQRPAPLELKDSCRLRFLADTDSSDSGSKQTANKSNTGNH